MNGSGSGLGSPSTLTCRSSIASSSAAWVFGGVRLISSASSRLVNTGPAPELELRGARVVDQRAGDVAGHQVGGELHPLEVQLQCRGQGANQQRLRDTRNPFQQHVAAAQQGDHQPADHGVLPDDGFGDLSAQGQQRCRADSAAAAAGADGWLCHD